MESLLSLSFDYLSSSDAPKIRKGLRQLEGLLAQICLSRAPPPSSSQPSSPLKPTHHPKRHSVAIDFARTSPAKDPSQAPPPPPPPAKQLAQLKDDAAFREFFKLQEGFEWNVAIRLISCLERLLGKGSNGQNDLLLVATLDLLQGVLLMHPPSRALFTREIYMNLLLDLLDPCSCPAIQSSTLLALVSALLSYPSNTRTFETLDGLLTVTSLFKSRSTSREVKLKTVEFLYFYLMPETARMHGESMGRDVGLVRKQLHGREAAETTRSTEEKQALLGRYLSNVEDLVEDLRESAPFGMGDL